MLQLSPYLVVEHFFTQKKICLPCAWVSRKRRLWSWNVLPLEKKSKSLVRWGARERRRRRKMDQVTVHEVVAWVSGAQPGSQWMQRARPAPLSWGLRGALTTAEHRQRALAALSPAVIFHSSTKHFIKQKSPPWVDNSLSSHRHTTRIQ